MTKHDHTAIETTQTTTRDATQTATREAARAAARAALRLANSEAGARDDALRRVHTALHTRRAEIAAANRRDLRAAEQNSIATPLLKRLRFQQEQIETARAGIEAIIALPNPLGRVLERRLLDTGLTLQRQTVPIGVIGVVFESRPDALVQIACLCLKSGNCCLMKGGTEAEHSNRLLTEIITAAACGAPDTADSPIPPHWLTALTTRDEVSALIGCSDEVDLIIPRGSNEFVRAIMQRSAIPVLGHADGVCHVYIDRYAEGAMAEAIIVDAKTQYPAVCNAAECLLIHRRVAPALLPRLAGALRARGVTLYGCRHSRDIVPDTAAANETHWGREYLALELSVRVVESLEEAIAHINRYGSKHTDAIVTADERRAARFLREVDSSSVMRNCSTRFSDGYRYGLGAEVGVSTAKIHARGPVGLEGLVSYKWYLEGDGHIVRDYSGEKGRPFLHQALPE